MKNQIIITSALFMLAITTGCKKYDTQAEAVKTNGTEATTVAAPTAAWQPSGNWQKLTVNEKLRKTTISDAAITSAIVNDGLVLVYLKNGNRIESLPFDQKIAGSNYSWSYQISEGAIEVYCETNDENAKLNDASFKYLVFSKETISRLKEKGISASGLMEMSSESAEQLITQ